MSGRSEPIAVAGFSGLQLIGRGGFSTVYRALQDRLNRVVAVKILHVDVSDPQARERFLTECAAAGRLANHPNIVTVYDSGFTAHGEPYLVMEYCDQGNLADRVRAQPMDAQEALRVSVKLAGALATAHAGGILHRDIKPENVLFTSYGEPALADFGIASVTTGAQKSFTVAALTPNHAAPEVLDGGRATAASDVYSLASTSFQILTGTPPFRRGTQEGLLSFFGRVVRDPAPPLTRTDLPAGLDAVVARGLAKTAAGRYVSAESFGLALQEVQRTAGYAVTDLRLSTGAGAIASGGEVVVAPPPPPPVALPAASGDATMLRASGQPVRKTAPPTVAKTRSRKIPLLVAGTVLLLLLGSAGVYLGFPGLFRGDGGEQPITVGATQATTTPGQTATPGTPAATSTPPVATKTATSPAPGQSAQQPTGPQIVYFRVKQQPRCPSGTVSAPIPGVPTIVEWKITGATGSQLFMDGDLYSDYGLQGSETVSFQCDGAPPGTTIKHTYKITTVGGGTAKSQTISAQAQVNNIAP